MHQLAPDGDDDGVFLLDAAAATQEASPLRHSCDHQRSRHNRASVLPHLVFFLGAELRKEQKKLFMVENRIAVGGLTDPEEDTVGDADETEDGEHPDDGLGDSIVEDTMPGINGLTVNPGRASKHKREDGNREVNDDDNNNN